MMQQPLRVTPAEPSASEADAAAEQPKTGWQALAVLGVVLGLLSVGVLLFTLRGSAEETPLLAIATEVPVTPTLAVAEATPAPACRPAADWLGQINFLEGQGHWQQAADTARLAATDPELCSAGWRELLQKAVSGGLEALFDAPFDPRDLIAQQAQLDRYRTLERDASLEGLSFPTALQVSQRARASGHFLLAKEAFEDALRAGQVAPGERSLLRGYLSSLHDLGRWWASATDPQLQLEGTQLLVTCHQIDLQERLGSGACYGALQELAGSDPQRWPAPLANPLLDRT